MNNQYKVLIITCWILYTLALISKLLGANIFEPYIDNPRIIKICEWFDKGNQVYILTTIIYIPTTYIPYLCMTNKSIGKDMWVILFSFPCSYLKDNYAIIGIFLDLFVMVILPLIVCKGRNWVRVIIGVIIILLFQEISLITRNQEAYLENETLMVDIVMSIDFYIIIILYYLYSRQINKQKGV